MSKTRPIKKHAVRLRKKAGRHARGLWPSIKREWRRQQWWQRVLSVICVMVLLFFSYMYTVAQWYIAVQADKPLKYGVTFIPAYASHLGLNPELTMQAMIDELGIRQFRLVSYWSEGEPVRGQYDFSQLDWQFARAERAGAKISLALGLRQPRWPECHMPKWAEALPMSEWSVELKKYTQATIERYRHHPALESYQLENEFFLKAFGICPDHSRERLIDEYKLVKRLDPARPVVVSRSNNAIGLPLGEPRPDVSAVSVYKRVWDKSVTKRYFEYPFPAWFYAHLAGAGRLFTGRDMIIHELQAEPWLPEGFHINSIADIPEQDKSMTAERLKDRIEYGRATGMKEIYLWGAEWWYWRKVKAGDPSLWNVARDEIHRAIQANAQKGISPYR